MSEASTVRTQIHRCRVKRVRGKRRRVCKRVKRYVARPKKAKTIKHRLPRRIRKGRYRVTVKATDRGGNRSKKLVRYVRVR